MKIYNYIGIILFFCSTLLIGCSNDCEYTIPQPYTKLYNDCLKRSVGPNLSGMDIEFTYAMSLGPERGKLVSAQVEASIAGDDATYLENNSYHTDMGGNDIPVKIGDPSVNIGKITKVFFTTDTCASTLRYFYRIPENAKGKQVSFTFTAKASTGEEVSYKMGPYQISQVDAKLDIVLDDANKCYFSIEDMESYNEEEALNKKDKIDLVYLYRPLEGVLFKHALLAPSNKDYFIDFKLPSGLTNNTSLYKVYGLRDRHLARLSQGVYVDDIDFEKFDFTNCSDFCINLKKESGVWVETTDKKYRAYIFINNVDDSMKSMTISIKRFKINQ